MAWAGLPLIGDVVSAGASIFGASSTNATNRDIARENNEFNAAQAQLNRDYQTQMSNTAHQREVADLRAAGLNPLLSANTGASSPGGSSASSSGNPSMQNPFANLNLGGALRDMAQLEMQQQSTQADVRVKDAQAAKTISDTSMDPTRKKLLLQQIEESKYRSHPNTLDQLITRYIDRFASSLESGVRQEGSRVKDATRKFISGMKPEDWSKLQNTMRKGSVPQLPVDWSKIEK